MKHLLAILLAMAMLFACKHDPDPTEPPTGCGMTIDQFPLKVGNSWTYEICSAADGYPYTRIGKIKFNIIGYIVNGINDTTYRIEYISFKNGDTSDYSIEENIRKNENMLIPFFAQRLNHSDGFTKFPLICTNIDTIENFKESDPLYSVIIKEGYAIKDTIFRIKNKSIPAVKCLRYERTKLLKFSYDHDNIFQWYYIAPNVGTVYSEVRGLHIYPYGINFNYKYILIDYKIL
ncbi:MAG: hypothetical protein IPN93_16665 [Bacteroidetes bacterium]|nr:hypothetical protein [Bacteroidota bacterium]MBP7256848.1 hypothetical protein [Chitinophagales bacterium]MBK8674548.1 hypothetical protein [Bacteroidota bacterium]MBK9352780.1 hypothetical protein [Bacteroidota bacterium]MBK9635071.1 hypothetical protein [Bacteroidota bacterium]